MFLGYFIVSKILNRKNETNDELDDIYDSKGYLPSPTMSEEEFEEAKLIFNAKKHTDANIDTKPIIGVVPMLVANQKIIVT